MEKEVAVFLVAIGGYGANYIEEFTARPELPARIEGICEIMKGMEERFSIIKEKSIPIYDTLDGFYHEHHAELAILSTPIHLHYEQIRTCLLAGSNVLTEKPVCTSVEGALKLIELEQETGRFVSVGYQLNYSRDVLAIKKDIINGVYGKPVLMKGIHAMRRGKSYYDRNNWAGRIQVEGCAVNDSPFNNACAHQFQNMTFLLGDTMETAGDIISIEAEPRRGNPNVENFDILSLRAMTTVGVAIYYYTAHPLEEKKLGPYTEFRFEHGIIYFGRDADGTPIKDYVGRMDDGRVIKYALSHEGRPSEGNELSGCPEGFTLSHEVHPCPKGMSSGVLEEYKNVNKGERLQKLDDALDCVIRGGRPVCTIKAALPHLRAVEEIAKLPVVDIPGEQVDVINEDGDCFWYVRHLKEVFEKCYEAHKLPGEIGL